MFRVNYSIQTRLFPVHRFYCQGKEKWYVLKIKEEASKSASNESQIVQKFREHETQVASKRNTWERFIETMRPPILKAHHEAVDLVKKMKIQEKALEFKNVQLANVKEKINDPETHKILTDIALNAVTTVKQVPVQVAHYLKIVVDKVGHYWEVFLKSEFRGHLKEFAILLWTNGKIIFFNVVKFIREAYFDKPTKPKSEN